MLLFCGSRCELSTQDESWTTAPCIRSLRLGEHPSRGHAEKQLSYHDCLLPQLHNTKAHFVKTGKNAKDIRVYLGFFYFFLFILFISTSSGVLSSPG